jgi:L-alanine-DL-glutamate epimerase-like enolase superfamily enzyme
MPVPRDVRITDVRVATLVGVPFRSTILRLDTNVGVSGYGEVRDGASRNYVLMLKRRLLGQNPLDISAVFERVRQFGYHGRQGGGVSAVDMALHDLAGRILEVPAYMLLGGRFRDRVRCYADTPTCADPTELAEHLQARREAGFTFLKMDLGVNLLWDVPGALIAPYGARNDRFTMHPYAGIQLTEAGLAFLVDHVRAVRDTIGYDIPLAVDHVGHIAVDSCLRLGRALEPFTLAWLEDLVPWQLTDQWRQLTEAFTTPTATGEDIYGREGFKPLIEAEAVRIIHPDPATAGGLAETKRIGDFAAERGIGMALHMAASPIATLAAAHIAAATASFLALEFHSFDVPNWSGIVTGLPNPLVEQGFVTVPDTPGLGFEGLDLDVLSGFLDPEEPGVFEPTDEWNREPVNDRLWS